MRTFVDHPGTWRRLAGDVVAGVIDAGICVLVEDPVRAPVDLANLGRRLLAAPPGETVVVDRATRRTTTSGWPYELVEARLVGASQATVETRRVAVYQLAEWVATVVVRARGTALDPDELARALDSVRPDWPEVVALAQLFS